MDEKDQKTLRPSTSPNAASKAKSISNLPQSTSAHRAVSDSNVDDYSDLATSEADASLQSKLASMKVSRRRQPSFKLTST